MFSKENDNGRTKDMERFKQLATFDTKTKEFDVSVPCGWMRNCRGL